MPRRRNLESLMFEADREFLRKRQEAVDEARASKFAVVGFALANASRPTPKRRACGNEPKAVGFSLRFLLTAGVS